MGGGTLLATYLACWIVSPVHLVKVACNNPLDWLRDWLRDWLQDHARRLSIPTAFQSPICQHACMCMRVRPPYNAWVGGVYACLFAHAPACLPATVL